MCYGYRRQTAANAKRQTATAANTAAALTAIRQTANTVRRRRRRWRTAGGKCTAANTAINAMQTRNDDDDADYGYGKCKRRQTARNTAAIIIWRRRCNMRCMQNGARLHDGYGVIMCCKRRRAMLHAATACWLRRRWQTAALNGAMHGMPRAMQCWRCTATRLQIRLRSTNTAYGNTA